jgi:hypothetical protein
VRHADFEHGDLGDIYAGRREHLVSALMHKLVWQAPRPLWRGTTPFAAAPQILRFASDDFMEQAIATLTHEPSRISERIVKPETWRTPPSQTDIADMVPRVPLPAPLANAKRKRLAKALPAPPPPDPSAPVKLYQPAHQRYYLVAGTLTCAIPGLPERAVPGGHETVHYVIRRLLPKDPATPVDPENALARVEYAYVKEGDDARWQLIDSGTDLAAGEELLPLFPLAHHDGLIPVARREEYLGKSVSRTIVSLADGQANALRPAAPSAPTPSTAARTAQLRVEVSEPWKAMVRAAIKVGGEFATNDACKETDFARRTRVTNYNFQMQTQSWLLLVDLRKWIRDHIPNLSNALVSKSDAGLSPQELAVWNFLGSTNANALNGTMGAKPMALSMRAALQSILAYETKLDAASTLYTTGNQNAADWPPFHFPLAGLTFPPPVANPPAPAVRAIPEGPYKAASSLPAPGNAFDENPQITDPTGVTGANSEAETLDRFTALLARALPRIVEDNVQPIPHALKLRDTMIKTAGDQGLFVIRMVHINADCGPLHPPTLSAPSAQFRLASFFDPEAPVRPITITLPADTSPAGLRKHGRGTAFVMSDLLCGQVQRAKGLGFIDLVLQVLPWPFHKDVDIGTGGGCKNNNLEIGMICSLSIPIITLCALILLIIIVTLLDFIFRWLPWFIACFPVPKLKGKSP